MEHGSDSRTVMTSLRRARQVLASTENLGAIKTETKRAYRRRAKQELKKSDPEEADYGMNPREFDTAWRAY